MKPDGVKFCLEATGHYWLPIYCYLTKLGFELHVINPIQSNALRNLYVRKTKTDQKDALLLADLLRLGRSPKTRLPSETTLKLQSLSRLRFEFVRQVGSLKNKVLGILDRIFPEYPDLVEQIEFIEEQIKVIEDAINEVMEELRPSKDTPYRHVIETIPGIGPVLAAGIIGD